MAVYTEVAFAEADALVQRLDLGPLTDLQGIRSGIENTNYYATTARGQWVLTLFERLPAQVGQMLARMHLAGQDFAMQQAHGRGLAWWVATAPVVRPHLEPAQAQLLDDELAFQQHLAASPAGQALPRGPIHADLFRDNVMFDDTAGGDRLCGFFDFYFAGTDTLLFDVAVCLNDWCADLETGALHEARATAFMGAYQAERALTPGEVRAMPALLRAAALRFWISRLWDWHLPRDAALLQPKDPTHFERVLRARIALPWHPTV